MGQLSAHLLTATRKARERQYESIKDYAVKYNVDEAMVYSLLSEYKGMLKQSQGPNAKIRKGGEKSQID